MGWASLVALLLKLLLELRTAESAEVFAANMAPQTKAYGLGDGEFLRTLWEHREEILAFVMKLLDIFAESDDGVYGWGDGELLKKLWENREEILAFVLLLIERFSDKEA